jgi:hypothetical protein
MTRDVVSGFSRTPHDERRAIAFAALAICAAAIVPYLSTIDDYFVRDDFGVVQLLAAKPWSYFPTWFHTSWMDYIWGFTPDEVRPFPAVSYQLTALGGASSPVLHHVFNILIHAVNGLLVAWIARTAASVSRPSAAVAGLIFVVLPVHTESVAWITGRVDSMPAFFYLASFLAYVRWRGSGSTMRRFYLASLVLFFVALFTKQNTITMVGTLAAYDLLILRRPWRPAVRFISPYVPFAVMTVGYLWLRYLLFGQVAREGSLGAGALADFGALVERHLIHVVTGRYHGSPILLWSVLAALAIGAVASAGRKLRELLYFGPICWLIGVAPVAVAGYSSPRHVYLAAVGWAVVLAIEFDSLLTAGVRSRTRRVAVAAAAIVLVFYVVLLQRSVRDWNVIAAVSKKAVSDAHVAALAAPQGSLVVLGAPERSWAWALPFAVRPPFAPADVTGRVAIISPRALTCCTPQWLDETREALTRWSSGPSPESVIALRWDEQTGELYRATSADKPELPLLFRSLRDIPRADDLDTNIRRILHELTSGVE